MLISFPTNTLDAGTGFTSVNQAQAKGETRKTVGGTLKDVPSRSRDRTILALAGVI
jgi:hypothetical protein